MFKRLFYLLISPLVMILAILACGGTPLTGTPLYTCPTDVPLPTATTLIGTPPPTMLPPSTPYIITSSQDFYIGDAVFIGGQLAPLRVRLRLQNVQVFPQTADEQVVTWELEVANVGQEDYEIFPSLQLYVSEVNTAYGIETGAWGATQAAGDVVGVTIDGDIYTLSAGQTQTFHFAAFTPAGDVERFTMELDPTQVDGGAVMTWINATNPYCSGDVAA